MPIVHVELMFMWFMFPNLIRSQMLSNCNLCNLVNDYCGNTTPINYIKLSKCLFNFLHFIVKTQFQLDFMRALYCGFWLMQNSVDIYDFNPTLSAQYGAHCACKVVEFQQQFKAPCETDTMCVGKTLCCISVYIMSRLL